MFFARFTVIIAVALIVIFTFAVATGHAVPSNGGTPYVSCQEDQLCWNWRTMGDHRRGITTLPVLYVRADGTVGVHPGRRLAVGACAFDRLNRAFRIDWNRTRMLHGDGSRYDVQNY